ncbi:LexA family protein [Paenibacillus sp. NPDC058177]|uniref:LexA family protein n=1 Tax=Paenibacillus sp. NPDC058177 TaxID=3346369 RepID=UPI0036DEF2D6
MLQISDGEKITLEAIIRIIDTHQISPTVREITKETGIGGQTKILGFISKLEYKGYISRQGSKPRTIRVLHHVE